MEVFLAYFLQCECFGSKQLHKNLFSLLQNLEILSVLNEG